jgi:glycerate kinase
MRVLVATDSWSGTLSAGEAGDAIAAGWRQRRPADTVTVVPVADGGLGTVAVLSSVGVSHRTAIEDALGDRVEAEWLVIGDTAVVEAASACGLYLRTERDPLRATTAGVGELLCAALGAGVKRVIVGVGGTASTDGGAGFAAALGAWLLDGRGHPVEPGGVALAGLDRVVLDELDPRLAGVTVAIAADVDNPLTGTDGAAYTYGPQKGASSAEVEALDAALVRYAAVVERDVPGASGLARRQHSGAGGGLAAGVMAFAGGRALPGAGVVLELLGPWLRATRPDVVVTGEGTFDRQSLRGKAPVGVAQLARLLGVPCLLLAGAVEAGRQEMAAFGFDASYAVADLAGSVEESLAAPAEWLTELAARVAGEWSR